LGLRHLTPLCCPATVSQDGNTPLHLAAVVGNTGNIKVLCDALGPQGVAACNKQQRTPLHSAAKYGRAGAVQQLLACLADMPGADQVGPTAAAAVQQPPALKTCGITAAVRGTG
jgi:ankyrin repeat protein